MADSDITLEARLRDLVTGQVTKMEQRLATFGTRAQKAMGKMRSASNQAKQGLVDFAKRFGPAAIAAAVLFTAVRKVGEMIDFVRTKTIEFEKTLSKVKAILRPTADEFTSLSNRARALGESTAFSATQAGEAFVELGKLGLNTNQIIASSADVLNLAAAASTSMENAAIATARTLGQYSLNAEEAKRVTDVMAKSFNISALDIDKFSESMKFVGPTASQLNITLEGTTAALAQLASQGVSGSMAGTALRRILLELGDSGSKAAKMIGFAVKSTDDFEKALGVLQSKNLSPGQIKDTFGLLSSTAAGILINGTESVKKFNAELLNADGTAKQMADTMLDNVAGATVILQSAQEGLALAIGETFSENKRERLELYTETVKFATSFIREHGEALKILGSLVQSAVLAPINILVRSWRGWIAIMEVGIGTLLGMKAQLKGLQFVLAKVANMMGADFDTSKMRSEIEALADESLAAFERAREAADGVQMGEGIVNDMQKTTDAVNTATDSMIDSLSGLGDTADEVASKFKFDPNSGISGPQKSTFTQVGGDPEKRKEELREAFKQRQEMAFEIQELELQMQEDSVEKSIALEQLRLDRQLEAEVRTQEFRQKATAVSEKNIADIRENYSKKQHAANMARERMQLQATRDKFELANSGLQLAGALVGANKQLVPILTIIKALEIGIATARTITESVSNPLKAAAGISGAAGIIGLLSSLSSGGRVPGAIGEPQLVLAHGGEEVKPVSPVNTFNTTINFSPSTTITGDNGTESAVMDAIANQPEKLAEILDDVHRRDFGR